MSTKTDKIDRLAELTAQEESSSGASLWKEALKRLRASKMALVGAGIIAVFLVLAILGPWVAPYAPGQQWRGEVFVNRAEFVGARAENWFGLDHLGRDIFSRMLVGARQTLLLGVISTLIGLSVGALIGSFSGACATLGGRVGQRIDSFIMRCIDIMLALPSLLLAVSVAAVLGQSITTVMIAIGVVQIPVFARLLRGAMLVQGGSDYVLAAHSLGIRKRRIVLTQIMPNSLSPVIVQATLSLATAIIEAAALSFLGLGNPDSAKNPEWGVMLTQAQNYADSAPMMAVYPALAIIITALGFTLLGEAMREALDPKLRG
ncbi:ABC transporter permease [Streptomyces sp. ZG43]|uniref:ABC transporter permease n=1 Tax=Streptomyces TaxID=1883 RepID=UPI000314C4F8|nr:MULTISPECIES: ABC transporter permease [unclassified Streptomyces]QOZ99010.1 ABC transporter permease [Streptomyces violascens]WSB22825.1 ABC transporter permease [Streptomyces albidoflavus]ESP99507.1 binding-protein-dependent transporters inner membrane component [Streptomyces sp. GBA 94-10 4N24]MBP3077143.1 ABC transporter permease [Streptomyces sp. 604F]QHV87673.1 ABC transporter permease [Streptomyces sp. 604F]